MTNKELVAEILRSNMDSEAKAEVVDLVYLHRPNEVSETRPRRKRTVRKTADPAGTEEK